MGKSATGFELFAQLNARGDRVAFIEIDQIGMCMPASNEARSAAKANNLLGMLDNYASAGADAVIVSGDIVEMMSDVLARARQRPVLCRLRADDSVTVERLTLRGGLQWKTSSEVYESYGPAVGDLDVITHGIGVGDVAAGIIRQLGAWPPVSAASEARESLAPPRIDSSAILITGPRAVGTSTVAWELLTSSVAAGHLTGYLDLDQLGFIPLAQQEDALATKLANIGTCWAGFRDQDAERLVLCGHADGRDLRAIRELIPSVRVAALTAEADTLLERARRRSCEKAVWLPGDDLFGRDDAYLRELVRQAASFDTEHADLVIETDGLTPADIAERIRSLWLDTVAS